MKWKISQLIILILITFTSCNPYKASTTSTSTPTSRLTLTLQPTNTPSLPSTITKTNTFTKVVTVTKTKPLISHTPMTEWENIPIMRGAYDIEVDNAAVSFYIIEKMDVVFLFYDKEIKKLGFTTFAYSEGGKGKMTFYEKENITILISIIPELNDENLLRVIIGKI